MTILFCDTLVLHYLCITLSSLKMRISRLLKILFLTVSLTMLSLVEVSASTSALPLSSDDNTTAAWINHHDRPQAVINNASTLALVCSSRPRRITSADNYLPSLHPSVRVNHLFYIQKISFSHFSGDRLSSSSPLMTLPACRYYVFALRRLLC